MEKTKRTKGKDANKFPNATTIDRAKREQANQPLVISYLRFSTLEQQKGDSVRRQIEMRDHWAAEHGFIIAPENDLRDKGISAFRGKNTAVGQLGNFLALVDQGKIPKGTILVIEALDRFSRNDVMKAHNLFTSILLKGITIWTLADNQEYNSKSDMQKVMYSVMLFAAANEASKDKSRRVGKAWGQKKNKDARNLEVITKKIPAWLEVKDGKIIPIPEKVAIVNEIFKLSLDGRGRNWITKYLNKKYAKSFARGFWSTTYLLQILRGKAVIGEYQPHKIVWEEVEVNGQTQQIKTRVPDGEPIPNYYPTVVDPSVYWAVQKSITDRRRTGGPTTRKNKESGEITDNVINIFQSVMFDMNGFVYTSKTNKEWRRYYISSARDGRDGKGENGTYGVFPADPFDFGVLFRLVDLPFFVERKAEDTTFQLAGIEGQIADVSKRLGELTDAIALSDKPLQTILAAATKLETRKAELEEERQTLLSINVQADNNGLRQTVARIFANLDKVRLGQLTTEERLALRSAIKTHIKRIDAFVERAEEDKRDYICSLRITLADDIKLAAFQPKTIDGKNVIEVSEESEIFYAFRMNYIDYRSPNYNKACPYEFEFNIGG